jgi:potassium-transporting ATPase KdpC subunit
MESLRELITQNLRRLLPQIIRPPLSDLFFQNIRPSLRVIILMILVVGIGYPILLVLIGEVTLPFQSNGSLLTLDGKIVGSKLIAQEFKSPKFLHSRPSSDSTSTVDPHITPDNAIAQVSNVSKATGIPQNTVRTLIELNIERNKVSNALVFAPQYVNVLEVNLDLVRQYPEHYTEFMENIHEARVG